MCFGCRDWFDSLIAGPLRSRLLHISLENLDPTEWSVVRGTTLEIRS